MRVLLFRARRKLAGILDPPAGAGTMSEHPCGQEAACWTRGGPTGSTTPSSGRTSRRCESCREALERARVHADRWPPSRWTRTTGSPKPRASGGARNWCGAGRRSADVAQAGPHLSRAGRRARRGGHPGRAGCRGRLVERWVAQTELGGATLLVASLVPAGMATSADWRRHPARARHGRHGARRDGGVRAASAPPRVRRRLVPRLDVCAFDADRASIHPARVSSCRPTRRSWRQP